MNVSYTLKKNTSVEHIRTKKSGGKGFGEINFQLKQDTATVDTKLNERAECVSYNFCPSFCTGLRLFWDQKLKTGAAGSPVGVGLNRVKVGQAMKGHFEMEKSLVDQSKTAWLTPP